MTKHFVWQRTMRGPTPEIWHIEPTDGHGKPRKDFIFKIALSADEEKMTLDQLAIKYEDKKNEPTSS